jgi:hypothetical protein
MSVSEREEAISKAWAERRMQPVTPGNTAADNEYEALIAGFQAGESFILRGRINGQGKVLTEIFNERIEQQKMYPIEHDDQLGPGHLVAEARKRIASTGLWEQPIDQVRDELIVGATLLVAAVETIDRKTSPESRLEKVAKVIHEEATKSFPSSPWESLPRSARETYLNLARVATAALEEDA